MLEEERWRSISGRVREPLREGVRVTPTHHQGGRPTLPRLRQPALRVCPHPLSGVQRRAPPDVLLPHPRLLSLLLSLERLSLDEKQGQVCYRYGKEAEEVERMDYLEFIARVTSHIPDKGQVTVRYYGLYANAHRGKVKKTSLGPFPLRIVEEELRPIPSKGWAEMIRKVYEVDPLLCPECGGTMKVIAFLTDYSVVDRIIDHLKLTFVAERPPPLHIVYQEVLVAAEASTEYFS
jgi:hypothetical protein